MYNGKTAKSLYSECETYRFSYLTRARECSELTLPTLVPPDGHSHSTLYATPYQGIGARGVNNLASKLLVALFPPNAPFFRLSLDKFKLKKLGGDDSVRTEMEKALADMERAVQREMEVTALRVPFFEALKHLIVAGNALVYVTKEGGIRVFRLNSFVVKRDPFGNVLHIVTKETISPLALPDEVKKAIDFDKLKKHSNSSEPSVDLFTVVCRTEKNWKTWQECEGVVIPETEGTYALDKSPYLPLRWSRVDGEDYGRGMVEEYLGDLKSLEALTKAVVKLAAASSNIKILVDPNGITKAKSLNESPSGAFVSGRAGDISVLQLDKQADLRVAKEVAAGIEQRLSLAFLLNTSIQRDAERVTAEEIRYMAQELEAALGGTYSILSQEFQLPLVQRIMQFMASAKKLPELPKGDLITPMIVTGVEALGRGNDLNKLDLFVAGVGQVFGPQSITQYINITEYLQRRATALGIETENLIRTPEDIQAEAQQAQMAQMAQSLGPQAIKSFTDAGMQQNDLAAAQAQQAAPPA